MAGRGQMAFCPDFRSPTRALEEGILAISLRTKQLHSKHWSQLGSHHCQVVKLSSEEGAQSVAAYLGGIDSSETPRRVQDWSYSNICKSLANL